MVEGLPTKIEALSSNLHYCQKKKKKKEKEKEKEK
jgi:hypothetical protein